MRQIKNKFLLYFVLPIMDLIMGTRIFYYYRLIKKMNCWSVDKIQQWQNERFKELIAHFYENSSYFRQVLEEKDLTPADFTTLVDINKLPAINKDIIQKNYDRIVPVNIRQIRHKYASTGGSTGNPLRFLIDYNSWSYTTAIKIYFWQKIGYLYGDRYIALGSSSLFQTNKKSQKHTLYFFLKSGIPLNGMNMSDEKIIEYIEILRSKKVRYIYGYASAIYLLARFVNKNNIKLDIRGCFPTSEILADIYRIEIEKAFNCPVLDGYGARDGGITAWEIHRGCFHVAHNSYAETIQISTENSGQLLVTDLLNKAFPFIRYEIGDETVLANQSSCSYNGQILTRILGRVSNVIRLENGRVITGPGFTILFKDLNVIAYRTSQINGKKIKLEIQPSDKYSKEEEKIILDTFHKHAGDDCEIELVYVDTFKISSSGKRMFFINA